MAAGYRKEYLQKLEGGGRLYESQIMSIILGNACGGKDMSAVADALLGRFPSVQSVLTADIAELTEVDGVTQNIAVYLKALGLALRQSQKTEVFIRNTEECFSLVCSRFTGGDNESAELYFVNRSGKVTDVKRYTSGKADRVDMQANDVFSVISSRKPYGLYFAHNHINCSAAPSRDDDAVTVKIATACSMCGVKFLDHCIISSTGDKFSYFLSGRLEKLLNK